MQNNSPVVDKSVLSKCQSLSKTCSVYMGRPLDKLEQISSWNARPLSSSQLNYAALDAHCCLGILSNLSLHPSSSASLLSTYMQYIHNHDESLPRLEFLEVLKLIDI